MRVMWITAMNLFNQDITDINKFSGSGGWVLSLIKKLKDRPEISELCVISVYKGKKVVINAFESLKFVFIPSKNGIFKYDKKIEKYLINEYNNFKPDIIDVQGIEFFLIKSVLDTNTQVPVVATIQGLTSEISKYYHCGISITDLILKRSLKDYLLFDGIIERKYKYYKRGQNEIHSLKRLKYIIGRTTWDKLATRQHNQKLHYFSNNRILRDEFYIAKKWNIKNIEKHSIFVSQTHYPIKGLHLLLPGFKLVKDIYPDAKLYIAGKNMMNKQTIKQKLKYDGYQKLIYSLIEKYKLEKSVIFTGYLDSYELIHRLQKSHIFSINSVIENSPNALAEAQYIGVPSIASNVGGINSYVNNKIDGLIFNPIDSLKFFEAVNNIFQNNEFAEKLSISAIRNAEKRHNIDLNVSELINNYKIIIDLAV